MIDVSILNVFKITIGSATTVFVVEADKTFIFERGTKLQTPYGNWDVVGVFINPNPPINIIANPEKSYWGVGVKSSTHWETEPEFETPFNAQVIE